MASLSMACLLAAAAAYHVSVPALEAIRTVEGGQQGQEVCGNFDGSCDLGPFQVNDKAWVGTLSSALRADRAIVRTTLRDDGCYNAQVASWILKRQLDDAHGDLPVAIGNYHSHYPKEHWAYRQKVAAVLQSLDPDDAPPALPGAAPGSSPGALRIPDDISGALSLPRAGGEQKGKLIRIGKPPKQDAQPEVIRPDAAPDAQATDPLSPDAPATDDSGQAAQAPVHAAPAQHLPKIYRGQGGQ